MSVNVILSDDTARLVEREIRSGAFATPDEAIRHALLLAADARETDGEAFALLQKEIDVGIADWKAGRIVETSARAISDAIDAEDRADR